MSPDPKLRRVGVVGLGRIGIDILNVAAYAAHTVKAVDQEQALVERGLAIVS